MKEQGGKERNEIINEEKSEPDRSRDKERNWGEMKEKRRTQRKNNFQKLHQSTSCSLGFNWDCLSFCGLNLV